jgi:hypothetical protein
MPDLNLEIMIGATEEIFFIATSPVAQNITSGGKNLSSDAVFQRASTYFLPDTTQIWYTNDEGLLTSLAIPLALIGPAVGDVFDRVIEDLNAPLPSGSPRRGQPPEVAQGRQPDPTQATLQALAAFNALIHSSSITATYDGEFALVRLVLTLE